METTTEQPIIQFLPKRDKRRSFGGVVFLIATMFLVAIGIYYYQFRPMLTMRVPEHQPLPIDSPPVELTSFQIRADGQDLTPNSIAICHDSIFVSFCNKSLIQIYSRNLKLVNSISLAEPGIVTPVAIAVTDSQLIVADTLKGLIAVYDHDGRYISSVAWYPGRKIRVRPIHLATDGSLLAFVDAQTKQVTIVSLIERQPYYDFLEMTDVIRSDSRARLNSPSCALIAPEGSIWVGNTEPGKGLIFSPTGDFQNEIEQPAITKLSSPADFAVADFSTTVAKGRTPSPKHLQPSQIRIHLLDKVTGKVCVYDLTGKLTLVYPQDRNLNQPTAIAISSRLRQIFISESENRSITVFGY